MTCVVGLKDERGIIIGADSAASDSRMIEIRAESKVFKNKQFLIGTCGLVRLNQLIRFQMIPPDIPDNITLFEYMVTKFSEEVRRIFREGGINYRENEVDSGGKFLVAVKDKLFRIDSDYSVCELLDTYDCIGSGENYAKGAMYALVNNNTLSSEDKVTAALEAAAKFSRSVLPPWHIERINNE